MPTWLDTYREGHCAYVWTEMTGMGADVRFDEDAAAVARETMKRARANVERLVEELPRLGLRVRGQFSREPFHSFGC